MSAPLAAARIRDLVAAVFADREVSAPTVSPDGRLVGWIGPGDRGPALFVRPLDPDGGFLAPARIVFDEEGLRGYVFLHDGASVLCLVDPVGDEHTRAVLLDREEPRGRPEALTPPGVQCRLLMHRAELPHLVFLGLNDRDPTLHDVHLLDLRSGSTSLLAVNPGYDSWVLDHRGGVRGGSRTNTDASVELRLDVFEGVPGVSGHPAWSWHFPAETAMSSGVRGIGPGDGHDLLWLLDGTRADPVPLVEFALEAGGPRPRRWWTPPGGDEIDAVWTVPGSGAPAVIEHGRWFQQLHTLEPATARTLAELRSALRAAGMPDGGLHVDRRDRRHDRYWAVTADSYTGSPRCGVWDARRAALHWLGPQLPALDALPAIATVPFEVPARDGLLLPGYLTARAGASALDGPGSDGVIRHSPARPGRPVGANQTGPTGPSGLDPAVVLVHGGPWERDEAAFDPETTALALAGYTVVRVNYRGSVGFGTAHLNAGNRQWGRAMSDDLDDVVHALVEAGRVDPRRVAIMGASYGGYAALMAACRDGFRYRCASAAMAPTDLELLIEGIPAYWRPLRSLLTERIGDPGRDIELLRDASPITHVARMSVPLLLAHGAADPRVPRAHVDRLVSALAQRGIDHEVFVFEREGHGLAGEDSRLRFFTHALAFLDRHLGVERTEAS